MKIKLYRVTHNQGAPQLAYHSTVETGGDAVKLDEGLYQFRTREPREVQDVGAELLDRIAAATPQLVAAMLRMIEATEGVRTGQSFTPDQMLLQARARLAEACISLGLDTDELRPK